MKKIAFRKTKPGESNTGKIKKILKQDGGYMSTQKNVLIRY